MLYKRRETCVLCKNSQLKQAFELPETPPANELVARKKLQQFFPISLLLCEVCGHLQLKEILPPDRLFRNYVYVSGTSNVFIKHFEEAATTIIKKLNIDNKSLIIEIGSNDGTLLQAFRTRGFNNILGIDPAVEIAKIANNNQIKTIPEFFDKKISNKILAEYGKAKLVLANNVFAHSNDLIEIANQISSLLDENGYFIFEVSYLLDVLDKLLFDTIYHEHLSYHTIKPLIRFLEKCGLYLFHVERINSHGGSIRCYASKKKNVLTLETKKLLELEMDKKLFSLNTYKLFNKKIDTQGKILREKIAELKLNGKKICGFGAPAKLTTLMYAFNLKADDFEFIIDDSKFKQGLFTPGMHIPIVSSERLYSDNIDACIVFAWNFFDSIVKKHSKWKINSKIFINPIERIE